MAKPVVLVHGWGSSARVWDGVGSALAADLQVFAVDLPGFGAEPPAGDPAAPDPAGFLRAWLEERGLEEIVLVGWSLGGLIVLDYVQRYGPHRLAGIGIIDVAPRAREDEDWPAGLAVGEGFADGLARWVAMWDNDREAVIREHSELALARPAEHPEILELLYEEGLRADPATALGMLLTFADRDFRAVLPHIGVPALLVFGGESASTTPWLAQYMHESVERATSVTFPTAGHAVMLEEPEAFADVVRRFAWTL